MTENRTKLTKKEIEQMAFPETGETWLWDSDVKELAIRARAKSKTFLVRKWHINKQVTVTLGKFPAVKIEQARVQARTALAQITQGVNPNEDKRVQRAKAVTLGEVLDEFLSNRDLKSSTAKDYRNRVNHCYGDWLNKSVTSITKDMVVQRHRKLSVHPAQANLASRILRALLNFASASYELADGKSILPENPVKRLSQVKAWNRIERRQTAIKADQLKPWYKATKALTYSTVRDYFWLCLFTGLRRNEAASLRWKNIDLNNRTLLIDAKDTKNHQPHMLPLSDYLYKLLLNRWQTREAGKDEFVFPGDGKRRNHHLVEFRRSIAKVTKDSGVPFMMHDLRRTFITIAEGLDIPHYALKKLVNHKTTSDVTAGYIISDVERLRLPMQLITDTLLKSAGEEVATSIPNSESDESVIKRVELFQRAAEF